MKYRCDYCKGNTLDDVRGNCSACGAGRITNKPESTYNKSLDVSILGTSITMRGDFTTIFWEKDQEFKFKYGELSILNLPLTEFATDLNVWSDMQHD